MIFEGGNAADGIATGDYIVTYQDNVDDGCPSTSMTISMVEAYTMNVVTNLTEMECGQTKEGDELMVTGGMGTVSAAWDHGVEGLNLSGLAGGQYYATVQDELGCTKDVGSNWQITNRRGEFRCAYWRFDRWPGRDDLDVQHLSRSILGQT